MNVSVSLRDLTRSFGDLTAVDGLSFDVGRGELFGIVGPDGAGKTTTLRMLAGVLRPTSGTAVLEGVDVAEDPEGAKLHLAYMAQRFGLYEDLTVAENLAMLDVPAPDGEVIHAFDDPINTVGGLAILRGSLAPKGSVVKVAGLDFDRFDGRARVFDGEDLAMEAVLA